MSPRTPILASVVSTTPLSPHLIRIVVRSDDLRDFPVGEFTDHYVKLQLPPPGASYSVPFDPTEIRQNLGKEEWHRQRTYTVREADPEEGTITIDFVTHGSGLAGPWARAAEPGDPLQLVGPGGAYSPDPEADWHLLAGDEAAIPAIAVFHVISEASARNSSRSTCGWKRIPPLNGPRAPLCWTRYPWKVRILPSDSLSGSETCTSR